MVQEHVAGLITDIDADGTLTINACVPSIDRALLRQYRECTIILQDERRITSRQRAAIYALLGEVDEYVNGIRTDAGREEQKQLLKMEFMLKRMTDAERRMFSLSDCSVTTARAFIDFIVEFIIANDIPTKLRLSEQCEDIAQYVYACLVHKKCAVCGRRADLHHVDAVGMGNDRNKVNHIGRECLPLCREHHSLWHQMGGDSFFEKYHLEPVRIDEKIAKIYHLSKRRGENDPRLNR